MRRIRSEEGTEVKCPLCGEVEDWVHVLLNCNNTENARQTWLVQGGYENRQRDQNLAIEIMRDNRLSVVQFLARFFNYVRRRREGIITRE